MTVELIIFDNDGVLVDSEILLFDTWVNLLFKEGISITAEEVKLRYLGRSSNEIIQDIEFRSNIKLPDDFEEIWEKESADLERISLKSISGAKEMLNELSLKKCVATSARKDRLQEKHSVAGLSGIFDSDCLFSSTMVKRGKPAPDLFLHAAKQMNVKPENCVVIEDSHNGVKAGVDAGMMVLGFVGGSHVKGTNYNEKLLGVGAKMTFDDLKDLPDIIKNLS